MYIGFYLIILCVLTAYAKNDTVSPILRNNSNLTEPLIPREQVGCLCGIFLTGQFKKGSKEQPKGHPALLHEHPDSFPCSLFGNKLCISKCLDVIVKHLPNSSSILCAAIDRDCLKERAYLFIKNCKNEWINTNLSAGREYCCKDGIPYKCPIL